MTSETRTLIEAGDITGIELECPECKITAAYPISRQTAGKLKPSCPHCNHQFFDMATMSVAGNEAYPSLAFLCNIVGNLGNFTDPNNTGIHVGVRFRLKTEEKTKS